MVEKKKNLISLHTHTYKTTHIHTLLYTKGKKNLYVEHNFLPFFSIYIVIVDADLDMNKNKSRRELYTCIISK